MPCFLLRLLPFRGSEGAVAAGRGNPSPTGFPACPRPHLRIGRPAVKAHCRDLGIPYAETRLVDSYRRALLPDGSACPTPFRRT
ncbi:hypothetical protein GCM10022384_30030 [Streptomyces marokkonensis]|uniref:Uncharacterized protein n=1 Tax=Streptomyces marokkonensis TaxID=324855 RepID=A0ABP7Q9D3_9ACTN